METNMKKIRLILQQYFGHATFRTGQEEIISRILQGKNVLGIMSTGGESRLRTKFRLICYLASHLWFPR
ncbi:hypothetical protein ACLMAB_11670 [Brevibacillus laterosporus]